MNCYDLISAMKAPEKVQRLFLTNWGEENFPVEAINRLKNLVALEFSTTIAIKKTNQQLHLPQLIAFSYTYKGNSKDVELPIDLLSFSKLKKLVLRAIKFDNAIILNQKELQSLEIHGPIQQALPEEIGALKSLIDLRFYNLDMRTFAPIVTRMKQLKILHFNRGQLRDFPKKIHHLEHLEQLHFSNNALQKLPDRLFRLPNLQYLVLTRCNLSRISSKIGQLTQLKRLVLAGNQLRRLPANLAHCKALSHIDCSSNELTNFPKVLMKLPRLQAINLYFNQLQKLPRISSSMPYLHDLDLTYNRLEKIPTDWSNTPRLQHLRLQNNHLKELPLQQKSFQQIKEVTISGNSLALYPIYFKERFAQMKAYLGSQKQIDLADYKYFYQALLWNEKAIKKCRFEVLVHLLKIPIYAINLVAIRACIRRRKIDTKQGTLKAGDRVAVVGQCHLDVSWLSRRLQELRIEYHEKVRPETTHIILGVRAEKYGLKAWRNKVWLRDFELNDVLIKKSQSVDNQIDKSKIELLLQSPEETSVELAYQLMLTYGVSLKLLQLIEQKIKKSMLPDEDVFTKNRRQSQDIGYRLHHLYLLYQDDFSKH